MSGAEQGRAPGSRLGPYEILGRIAAGGMGEVYRARDSRLPRDIALKVLSDQFTADRQRLQRFEREARVVSALNHPNIVTVFEIGQSDAVPFIAMELVEGQSLRQTLRAGGMPLRKLLDLATQMAEGLARAHEAGVVHRDLKPDNVMVTPDGGVKILDFGLAKLTRSFLERGAAPEDGTLPLPTEPGVLIGTVRYMAPEQASGQPADFRSDQFSFGSVLYEMATGEPAFQRATTVDTLSAILHEEPRPLAEAAPKMPTPLRWVIERCLSKDAGDRYAATRDLAHDLATIRERISEVSGAGERPTLRPRRTGRRWLRFAAPVAMVLLAALAGMWIEHARRPVEPPTFRQLTFRRGEVGGARFAPDGQSIVFAATWEHALPELFVQRLGSPEARPFGLSDVLLFGVSRSGELALSVATGGRADSGLGTLARLDMGSVASPRPVLDRVSDADWGPDGELAVVRDVEGRSTLEYPIGHVLYRESAGWLASPRVSRRGDLVAFVDHPIRGDESGDIRVVDSSGHAKTLSRVLNLVSGMAWPAADREIWFTASEAGSNCALYGVDLAGRRRTLTRGMGAMSLRDVAADGRALIAHFQGTEHVKVLAPGSDRERELTWLDLSLSRAISDDGRLVLILESGEGGGEGNSVYLRRSDGSPAIRLGEGGAWALSPDGAWAAALVDKPSGSSLVLYPVGPGEARRFPLSNLQPQYADWLPDGGRILMTAAQPGHGPRLYVQNLETGNLRPISDEGYRGFQGTVTPDGSRLLAENPGGDDVLYPIDGGQPKPIAALTRYDVPRGWNQDGRHIYVTGTHYTVPRRVDLLDVISGERILWKEIGLETGAVGIHVTPDGRSYVYSYVHKQADLYLVEGLR